MAKRRTTKAAPKVRRAKAKRAATSKAKRPDGSISAGIYDAVEKLVADGKMKRSEAFRQLAKESGRNANTVAVNYYYVAKKRGGGKKAAKKVGRLCGIGIGCYLEIAGAFPEEGVRITFPGGNQV